MIILLMVSMDISLDDYQHGASIITFMLAPATVSLAVPLYNRISILKKHAVIILVSICAGAVASVISSVILARLLGLPEDLVLSLVPKSVTTPIAVEASERLGGVPSITAISVIITGISGAVFGPFILKFFRVSSPLARGLAMGTSSHAIGTSRALEMGETEGAAGSLSIGIAGIITVLAAPMLLKLLG